MSPDDWKWSTHGSFGLHSLQKHLFPKNYSAVRCHMWYLHFQKYVGKQSRCTKKVICEKRHTTEGKQSDREAPGRCLGWRWDPGKSPTACTRLPAPHSAPCWSSSDHPSTLTPDTDSEAWKEFQAGGLILSPNLSSNIIWGMSQQMRILFCFCMGVRGCVSACNQKETILG